MNKSDAYWEGYNAYLDGKYAGDNPYNTWGPEEPLWEEWNNGYWDAGWDD